MAEDARTHFVNGLRVTADHLQHLQDRLRESVSDLRRAVGIKKIAWGFHVVFDAGSVLISPGVAFAPSGVRLNLDTDVNLGAPTGAGPWRVTIQAKEQDRQSLRVDGEATLILLITTATLEAASAPDPGADALIIAQVKAEGAGFAVQQDAQMFAAAGFHKHSGQFIQGADGRWYFDGPQIEGGSQGPKGDNGDKGDKGDNGDKGADGAPGVKGDKGDTGDKGDKGDTGAAGADGSAGARGDKGDKGDRGDKGDKGDTGTAGADGAPGAKGDKGDKGDTGDAGANGATGARGTKGDKGDPGAPGVPGAPGAKGDKGDKGDPGAAAPGLTFDFERVRGVSWSHGKTVNLGDATNALNTLRVDLTGNLLPETQQVQPMVLQVWYLPDVSEAAAAQVPSTILFFHGTLKLEATAILWKPADSATVMRLMLGQGGQVLIRIHCGYLFDTRSRPFSAALDAVSGHPNPMPVPGGIFESWFFVNRG